MPRSSKSRALWRLFLSAAFSSSFSSAMICSTLCRTRRTDGGVRRSMSSDLFRLSDQQRDLAFHAIARLQRFQNVSRAAAQEFFVQFRDLARNHHTPVASQKLDHIRQRFDDPVRSLIKNLRARRSLDSLKRIQPLAALRGKESAEAEGIGGQATGHQRRKKCGCAGNRHHRQMMRGWPAQSDRKPGSEIPGMPASVTSATLRPFLHIFHQFRGAREFVVLVIADGAGGNAVMVAAASASGACLRRR